MITWFTGLDRVVQALLASLFTWGVTAARRGHGLLLQVHQPEGPRRHARLRRRAS